MDYKIFFDNIRGSIPLTQGNVAGFERVIGFGESHGYSIKDTAYVTATAYWETANTMQPVKEAYWLDEDWRKKHLRYYPWYGRGDVQLTWEDNYKKAGKAIGVDLISNPEKALDPAISVQILYRGMENGWFSGKKLSDYITPLTASQTYASIQAEYRNARRIVNGTDKQDDIASIAIRIYKALQKASYTPKVESIPVVVETPPQPPIATPEPIPAGLEITLRKGDLSKVTLEDFYLALKSLYEEK